MTLIDSPRAAAEIDTSPEALARLVERVASTAAEYDRSGDFPWQGIRAVHEAGILRLGIGERFGGRPTSVTELARVLQALGGADASVALITSMTILQHLSQDRAPWWPENLYREAVATVDERPFLLNAIRAEPEWGAPARGGLPATTIRRDGDGWVLNGRKGFATGSEGLAFHLVWAATDEAEPRVAHAIVPADAPGIEIVRTWDHLGLRASSTHDVIYTDVVLPLENFQPQDAAQSAASAGVFAGYGLAVSALYLGVARAAGAFFTTFAQERVPTSLGRPIATTERIQTVAGEIEAQLIQAEEVLYGLAARIDTGDQAAAGRTLIAKTLISRSAISAVETAVAAIGNPGLSRHNPLERHLRDVLCSRVHPPQDDAALLALGRQTLAL